MRSVSHCKYTGSNVVAMATDEKGFRREIYLQDARAGIMFPTGANPGYFLIFGRQREQVPSGKHRLLFLGEGEDIMHELLFEKLTDACAKYKCKTVYAWLPRTDRKGGVGGYDDLWRYFRNRRLQINLIPAPSADDVEYGKAMVREFLRDKAMDIPIDMEQNPCTLNRQLAIMSPKTDDKDLYAFHALRFLIGGFVKFNNVIQWEAKTESRAPSAKGWT